LSLAGGLRSALCLFNSLRRAHGHK
jgi:hypothetical protein